MQITSGFYLNFFKKLSLALALKTLKGRLCLNSTKRKSVF